MAALLHLRIRIGQTPPKSPSPVDVTAANRRGDADHPPTAPARDRQPSGRRNGHVRGRGLPTVRREISWGRGRITRVVAGLCPDCRLCYKAGLRVLHSQFDGGQPGADCLTPQLRTNGHLATDTKRNLLKSVAVFQRMPKAAGKKGEPARPPPVSPHGWRIRSN
jgi:hypothetical protein